MLNGDPHEQPPAKFDGEITNSSIYGEQLERYKQRDLQLSTIINHLSLFATTITTYNNQKVNQCWLAIAQ